MATLFEQAGAEPGVRAIIDDFVERVFADPMIGFFFAKASKERIKAKEYEFAAKHLGATVPYTGRPLPDAHAAHPITGGHFMRRMQILKQTLQDHRAPSTVIDHWLEHSERMRPFITRQAGSSCDDDATPAEAKPAADPTASATSAPAPTAAKAAPSIDEINAYLERSAAMTKKRLPLVFRAPESEVQPPAAQASTSDTSLPVTVPTAVPLSSQPGSSSEAVTNDATAPAAAGKGSRALPLVGKPVR